MDDDVLQRGWEVVIRLAGEVGPRVAGSSRERTAADLIADEFAARGLQPRFERFRFVGWEAAAPPALKIRIGDGSWQTIPCWPMAYTGNTPSDGVTGPLSAAGVCELVPGLLEWPRYRILDDRTGEQAFVAVVPDGEGRTFPRPERQLLLEPIVITGSPEFSPVLDALDTGVPVEARVRAAGRYVEGLESQNVIAEVPGSGPGTIVIAAHYDTVPGSPGAGDDASGVGGCLALAEHYRRSSPSRTLQFIAWGAHELGLLGSQHHMQERAQRRDLDGIEAMLALDILSDGDRIGVWAGGPALLGRLGSAIPDTHDNYPVVIYPRGRGETDSWSYAERGIDTVMILTLPYSHFHLPTDTVDRNDPALFAASVRLASRMVDLLIAGEGRTGNASR
jgi:hypothetical protein